MLLLLVMVFGVVRGHGVGLHVMVWLLRGWELLVGLWVRVQGCQYVLDGWEDVVVVLQRAVGSISGPVGGSGGTAWFLRGGAVYGRVGGACGWWRARSAMSRDPRSRWHGGRRMRWCFARTLASPARLQRLRGM